MRIAIGGGHGKIAMRLTRRLVDRGETVLGLIRNPVHADDVRAQGGHPVVCDLERSGEDEIVAAIRAADAVVFAAGAGPGSGAERKLALDRDGAIKLLRATSAVGASRYLIISAVGAEQPPSGDDVFSVYLRAKAEADAAVRAGDREWTIVRPGRLTDDPPTGRVRVQTEPFRTQVPREDVASVLDALLADPRAVRRTLYVGGGHDAVGDAVARALAAPPAAE